MADSASPFAIRKLLVGLSSTWDEDGETLGMAPCDQHAAMHAVWLAAKVGAELRFIHVIDFLDARYADDSVAATVRQQIGPAIDQLTAAAKEAKVTSSFKFLVGTPWRGIADEADSWGADVIAVSPRRRDLSTFDRLRYGSTARRLLRHARCDVWVVDPNADLGFGHVMGLVDRSDVSPSVVAVTGQLADVNSAKRTLLHCMDYPDDVVLHRLPHAHRAIANYHNSERERAQHDLALLVGEHLDRWTLTLDNDWVVRATPRLASRNGVDLVVIAGVSHPGLRGVMLGTTAERIIDRTEVSVWVVRR